MHGSIERNRGCSALARGKALSPKAVSGGYGRFLSDFTVKTDARMTGFERVCRALANHYLQVVHNSLWARSRFRETGIE